MTLRNRVTKWVIASTRGHWGLVAGVLLALVASESSAQTVGDLGLLSLEDLMNLEVTSVSKKSERLSETAAAVHVLTSEDIRRSGATSIPEALRFVPGVHVARIDSSKWSVSVRGFSGRFSNKLLVLVDGRSVYAPLFSGVLWDTVNVPLDVVERIEVVRGPGATVWGANAVNGVINIITRSAEASTGHRLAVTSGSDDRAQVSVSVGRPFGAGGAVRADASWSNNVGFARGDLLGEATDGVHAGRLGVRVDKVVTPRDHLTLHASFVLSSIRDGWAMPSLSAPFVTMSAASSRHGVGAVHGEWVRQHTGGETSARLVVEQNVFREALAGERRRTIDVELQRHTRLGARHELAYGSAVRVTSDRVESTPWFSALPVARTISRESGFVQDDIHLAGNRVSVTVGAKVEHNSYTGVEFQPNVRAMATLSSSQAVWVATSRAVRLPSRAEVDGQLWVGSFPSPDAPFPVQVTVEGSGVAARAERLVAQEVGYRYRLGSTASLDVTGFHNRYDRLRTPVQAPPVFDALPMPHLRVASSFENIGRGSRYGSEVAIDWRPMSRLRVTGAHSWLGGGTADQGDSLLPVDDDAPRRQTFLRTALSLPARVEVDGMVRTVSALRASRVAGYTEADVRVGVRLPRVTVSVVGRNLLAPGHVEYVPEAWGLGRARVPRALTIVARVSR